MHSGQQQTSSSNNYRSPIHNNPNNLSDCCGTDTRGKFQFPPPPRISKSENASSDSSSCSNFSTGVVQNKRRNNNNRNRRGKNMLPPMGFFWDIENCQVPKRCSGAAVVGRIREFFLEDNFREAEFVVVCDVKKERPQVIQELHDSQVNLIHVASISKNAADEKLRQSLRRFAEVHQPPCCVVLISGDINFAADLSDLRYRKKIRVILVHNTNVSDALMFFANETFKYEDICLQLPLERTKPSSEVSYLLVSNLPSVSCAALKARLNFIANNCGGKVQEIISDKGLAYLRFCNKDYAERARIRIQGEDVYGQKIKVISPSMRSFTGRNIKNAESAAAVVAAPSRSFIPDRRQSSVQEGKKGTLINRSRTTGTPQDVKNIGGSRDRRISGSSEFSDDSVVASSSDTAGAGSISKAIVLHISNLDPNINMKELKRLLTNMFIKFVTIISLNVYIQGDNSRMAKIVVSNQQEARLAISQLQKQKLGDRRIYISILQNNSTDLEQLKALVVGILQEEPQNKMPLFKLIDLIENLYKFTVSVSQLLKLNGICKVTDEYGARIIQLSIKDLKLSPPPGFDKTFLPYCTTHCPNGFQQESSYFGDFKFHQSQINVMMPLKCFAQKLYVLLGLHFGSLPLSSFHICYLKEFREALPINEENGVPLEHLISCVENIEISMSGPGQNIKIIHQIRTSCSDSIVSSSSSSNNNNNNNIPSPLASNVRLFSREIVELLKTTEKCQLALSKFIPAYHHHFSRQCHVAAYGYTKLIDLLMSIPHVVQILGDGHRRQITLSHQAQMRRFTSDLFKVLKSQTTTTNLNQQILNITEFPQLYEKVFNKKFNPIEYGLCRIEDLFDAIPKDLIQIDKQMVSIPKKEQTLEEIKRTKQFANEAIDLLKHSQNFTMLFEKFVPAYHHHFGHQLKVSNYGFTKLNELFDAISDVIKIEEIFNERTITLTIKYILDILGERIVNLIKKSQTNFIKLYELPQIYLWQYGYPLKPKMYKSKTLVDLILKLKEFLKLVENENALDDGPLLIIVNNKESLECLKIRSWALLLNPPHCERLTIFQNDYQSRYNHFICLNNLQEINEIVISTSSFNNIQYVTLTQLYALAARIYFVLYTNNGSVYFNDLEKFYYIYFGTKLNLVDFQINSIDDLHQRFTFLFDIYEFNKKQVLALNPSLVEHQIALPFGFHSSSTTTTTTTTDLLPLSPIRAFPFTPKISAPKPDTPPTPSTLTWSPPYKFKETEINLNISLPIIKPPEFLWPLLEIKSPHPHELPMPNKLVKTEQEISVVAAAAAAGGGSDSTDSGVNSKLENSSLSDMEDVDHQSTIKSAHRFSSYFKY